MAVAVGAVGRAQDASAIENKGPTWAAMLALVRERFPQVSQLSTAELAAWRNDAARPQPVLLDAREPAEFAVSRLPGAVRVAPDATAKAILAQIEPGRPVVGSHPAGPGRPVILAWRWRGWRAESGPWENRRTIRDHLSAG